MAVSRNTAASAWIRLVCIGPVLLAACSTAPVPQTDSSDAASLQLPLTEKLNPAPLPPADTPQTGAAPRCDFMVTLQADEVFQSDAVRGNSISPDGAVRLARDVMAPLTRCSALELVSVVGFSDRIGTAAFNQALSEQRAETIKAFMVEHGVPAFRISASGAGAAHPVSHCDAGLVRHALIACLAPDRRVEIDVRGSAR